ncbi:peptidoglycan-binding protein [Streptomyces sp. NPDC096097]|uniref:peptidoglycan-binding protein n=1 Tax=Streptomyces sp. NPDC096097 TaxID=3155546 RepID=UPI003325FBC2
MGIACGAVLLSGAGTAAAQLVKSPAQAAADSAAPPRSLLTAPVERRVLKDSVILRGTVTAEQSVDVKPSAKGSSAGVALVTKTPLAAGEAIRSGALLLEVSGRPVFALKGALPAYRDIKPGMNGQDVAQLQNALRELGHGTGGDSAGSFGAGTKEALKRFYESIGYTPAPAQQEGATAVRDARRTVTDAERRLQDIRDGGATAEPSAPDGARPGGQSGGRSGDRAKETKRAQDDLDAARRALNELQAVDGPMLPASEVVFLSGFPARVDSLDTRVGAEVSGKAMTVSAGALVVNGYLQAHQKGLVRKDQKVHVLSESTGASGEALVVSVADTPARPATGGDAAGADRRPADGQGYLMVVKPTSGLDPALAGQGVRLTVEAGSTGGEVLVVPVSAISAGADGVTSVQVVAAGGSRRTVGVTTGATGDGFVEVRVVAGATLNAGDKVVVGLSTARGPGAGR